MVFPRQGGAVACYRHEKFKPLYESAIAGFPVPEIGAVRGLAAAWTRNIFGTCCSEIAIDPRSPTTLRRRQRVPIGAPTMITLTIFWALVLALFTSDAEQPDAHENKPHSAQR